MDEQCAQFMDITSVSDPAVAASFLEMSGGDLQTAVGLFFEHGAGIATDTTAPTTTTTENADADADAELANRLQQEMYQEQEQQQQLEDEVRQPIQPTHDTLLPQEFGFGAPMGMNMGMNMGMGYSVPQGGMFGRAQRSVFNQTDAEGDGVAVVDLDSDDDMDEDYEDTNRQRSSRMTATQKRLAAIFRPPWDIITKVDLDTAKQMARNEGKWILINIQDVEDFRCQCLNRDFWSSQQIKQLVRRSFVFLQYQHDSHSGEMYRNLYNFNDEYPHIAILDPMTGERMLMWNKSPNVHAFVDEVTDFLARYPVDGSSAALAPSSRGLNKSNAIDLDDDRSGDEYVDMDEFDQHEDDEDDSAAFSDADDYASASESEPVSTKVQAPVPMSAPEPVSPPKELTYEEKIKQLQPQDLADPPADLDAAKLTTRIQIRSGIDGKRVVKKVALSEPVRNIFAFTKHAFAESLEGRPFTLKMQRTNLTPALDDGRTVAEWQLQNAALMLEVVDDDDDDDDE